MGKEARPLEVKDIKPPLAAKINQSQRAVYLKIVDDEFQNQDAIFKKDHDVKREEIIAAYRKKYKLEDKIEEYAELMIKAKGIEAYLDDFGLTNSGTVKGYGGGNVHFEALGKQLKVVQDEYSIPRTNKNKYKAQMNMAQTHADASIILREIMGNGIIPTVTEFPKLLDQ